MSFFARRRGLSDPAEARPVLKPVLKPVSKTVKSLPPAGATRVRDALEAALHHLRALVPERRDELVAIGDDFGRAHAKEDYEEVIERLRSLPLPVAHAVVQVRDSSIEVFQRVLFGARPIAEAFGLRGAAADLTSLLLVPELSSAEDRAVAKLLRVLETFAIHAARTRDGRELMKRCVSELIEMLGRLSDEEGLEQRRLETIRVHLESASELEDLERLRSSLLTCADSLVHIATERQAEARRAFEHAVESRRRAAELEAALTDAEEEARTDVLTGLPNRRALDETIAAAAVEGDSIGVLALDLDHFKDVNDRHGHGAGDLVLQHVAYLLNGELRGDDRAFRVGGEELLVLLPNACWQGARATAERLRARMARVPVPVGPGLEIPVTMSIGVALWCPPIAFEETLEEADRALYRAKTGGRNRVVG